MQEVFLRSDGVGSHTNRHNWIPAPCRAGRRQMNADDRLLLTFAAPLLAWLLMASLALAYSRRGTAEVHLNVISVLGAVAGYLALTQGWSVGAEGVGEVLGVVLFMFGSLIAILTPLGGLVQVAALAYIVAFSSNLEVGLWTGPSVLSTALVLSSIVVPYGLHGGGSAKKPRHRFLTISVRRIGI